jgi:hypothetical protein
MTATEDERSDEVSEATSATDSIPQDELVKIGDHRTFLRAVTGRLKRSYAVSLAQDAAVACAVVVGVIAAAVWFLGIAALPMVIAAGAAVVLAFAFVTWRSVRLRPEAAIVARLADQRCDAGDVFASTLVAGDSPFSSAIMARADSVSVAHVPSDIVRARVIWWKIGIAIVAVLAALWLFATEGPGAHQRAITQGKKAAVEKAAENVRRSAEKLKQQGADPKLTQQLDALAKSLDRTNDPLEAARLLDQSALSIQPEDPAQALARKAAVKGLERGLATKPIAPGETAADQLRNAAASVEVLPDSSDLQKRLGELAKSQQSNPEAAKQLQKAADALAKGDTQAAKDALQKAADAQEKAAEQSAADQERANQAGQLKSSSSSLQSQSQQQSPPQSSPGPSLAPGQTAQPGQTLAPGQTLPPGQGTTPGQKGQPGSGQPGSGSRPLVTLAPGQTLPSAGSLKPGQTVPPGASTVYVQTNSSIPPGASTLPVGPAGSGPPGTGPAIVQPGAGPGASQGGASSQGGGGVGGKQAGRGANNSVGPPGGTIAGTTGEVYAPGVVTPGGSGDVVGVGAAPSPAGKSRVPVAEALPASKDKAAKALDSSDLDPSEQDVVKGYFDSLNAPPPAPAPAASTPPASAPPATKAPAKGKK